MMLKHTATKSFQEYQTDKEHRTLEFQLNLRNPLLTFSPTKTAYIIINCIIRCIRNEKSSLEDEIS